MEAARERPERGDPGPDPVGEPVREPAPGEVVAKASPVRCPFCHADVRVEQDAWLACRGCLARHHAACWRERGACAACGVADALDAPAAPAGEEAGMPRAIATVLALSVAAMLAIVIAQAIRSARGSKDHAARAAAGAANDYADAIRAAATLGQSDCTEALLAILKKGAGPKDQEAIVRLVAGRLASSSDRHKVYLAIVDGGPLAVNVRDALLQVLRGAGADHAEVLQVLARDARDESTQQRVVDAAMAQSSSKAQADVLITLIEAGRITPGARTYLSDRVQYISYSSDRKRVVDALIGD